MKLTVLYMYGKFRGQKLCGSEHKLKAQFFKFGATCTWYPHRAIELVPSMLYKNL